MKVSAYTAVRYAMLVMLPVVFLVPTQFIVVPLVIQIGLVILSLRFRRRGPRSPMNHDIGPIHPR